ncbi:hypothetical protein BIW11_10271, partial [Tropilaelaps mercedesae]
VLGYEANSAQMRDLLFIHDILQKITKLKLVTSPNTIEGEVCLSRFGSLRHLELQRVPPHLLTIMYPTQSAQIEVLEAHRCLTGAKALLKLSGGASWSRLETLRLSHNMLLSFGLDHQAVSKSRKVIKEEGLRVVGGGNGAGNNQIESRLNIFEQSTEATDVEDDMEHSLQMAHLLPALRNLDLSHNQIQELDLCGLQYLSCVDLSFNFISRIPQLHRRSSLLHLTYLCLRNNLLEDLRGLEALTALKVLDLGHNMLCEFSVLEPLTNLLQLDRLTLEGNPISLHGSYRTGVSAHIAKTVILDGQYDVHSERIMALTTIEPTPVILQGCKITKNVGERMFAGEIEGAPSLTGVSANSSSVSSVRTGKTKQSIIDDPSEREKTYAQLALLGPSLKRMAEECRRDGGHDWLLIAARELQMPTAQCTPLLKPSQALYCNDDRSATIEANSKENIQKRLFQRRESRQSVVTDKEDSFPVELDTANTSKGQTLLKRGACPIASLSAATLMTTSQTENAANSTVKTALEVDSDQLESLTLRDKEESSAIGVIDVEPPEIKDEDTASASADTASDGTFLSAYGSPTCEGDDHRTLDFTDSGNMLEAAEPSIVQTDPSLRRSLTSMARSGRLKEDSAVWAKLRELRRSGIKYDAEHSMPAEEKVHLEMQVFKKDENFQVAFKAHIVLTNDNYFDGFVILSEHRIYASKSSISKPDGGVLWFVPLSRLCRAIIQMGAQALVLEADENTAEWGPAGGSGTAPSWLLAYVGDAGWCGQLAQQINIRMPEKAPILRSEVGYADLLAYLHLENENLRAYSQGYWKILDDGGATSPEKSYVCIAIASQDVIVVRERHVEPEKVKFTEVCTQSITAVTSLALEENDPRIANVTFALDETGTREQVWYFETASAASMFVFIESLRQPWQEIFDVELPLSYI